MKHLQKEKEYQGHIDTNISTWLEGCDRTLDEREKQKGKKENRIC